eukprot:jgi/Botrbrau1/7248/Bobra.0021s0031.1
MRVGLVADTHGVVDQVVLKYFCEKAVDIVVHAGDVGNYGGEEAVIRLFQEVAPTIAVRGNVDDGCDEEAFPSQRILTIQGWVMLVTHVVRQPQSAETQKLIKKHGADIVVFGHSHIFFNKVIDGIIFVNPGSAGPRRFHLGRSIAILHLPPKGKGSNSALPEVEQFVLPSKAPPRILACRKRPSSKDRQCPKS